MPKYLYNLKKSYNMRWFQNPDKLAGLFVIGMRQRMICNLKTKFYLMNEITKSV